MSRKGSAGTLRERHRVVGVIGSSPRQLRRLGDYMRRLGELLVDQGLLTDLELDAALRYQEAHYFPLGEIVVGQGYVSRPALARALASQRERDLEFEGGFGSGLFALLDERHALRRSLEFERAAPAR